MGYTLKIGEAEISVDPETGNVDIVVKDEKHPQAPAFGELTDYTNVRCPSYTSWTNFTKFAGIHDMFYNESYGLIRYHPGVVSISDNHKRQIDEALVKYKEKYPNAVAGYSPKIDVKNGIYEDLNWPEENNWLTRLEWLKYWVDWALENCDRPVFKNT